MTEIIEVGFTRQKTRLVPDFGTMLPFKAGYLDTYMTCENIIYDKYYWAWATEQTAYEQDSAMFPNNGVMRQ